MYSHPGKSFYRTWVWSLSTILHCRWLTHSLTPSRFIDLINVTLACEDSNSILVEVVTLDTETHVDNSLVQICKLWKDCHEAKFLFRLWAQVWSRFWNWSFSEIWKLKFGQCFAADVWLRLWSWVLVEILKLGLVKILKLMLWSIFWRWKLMKICVRICDMSLTLGSVVPLAMFYDCFMTITNKWS